MSPHVAAGARGLAAAALVWGTYAALTGSPAARPLERVNHAGRPVTLAEGPAVVAGLTLGGPGPAALALATGSVGLLDDLGPQTGAKGLRGHLAELRRGRVTTGSLKIAGIGLAALAATVAADRRVDSATLPGTVLVAGGANLLNLLDLRPGRALKVAGALALPAVLHGGPEASAVLGSVLAAAPRDLAGRSMLGDTGANALGAVLAQAYSRGWGTSARWAGALMVTGLIAASERVSFTAVIAGHPVLDAIDRWGRPR